MHFGISEGKVGVKTWKPSVVGYGYFLELPIGYGFSAIDFSSTAAKLSCITSKPIG